MASFHLAIVPWSIRAYDLVTDAMLFKADLKQGRLLPVGGKAISEFRAVVSLDAFNGAGKDLQQMLQKQGRGIRAVLLKSLHVTPAGILVNGGVLKELFLRKFTVY